MDSRVMQESFEHLDKQTLITLLMAATSSNTALQKTVEQLNRNIAILTEEVASLRQERFGRKSEKNLSELEGQYTLIFNETEATIVFCQ